MKAQEVHGRGGNTLEHTPVMGRVGLPDLANEKTGHVAKLECQVNKKFIFIISTSVMG